MNSEVRVITSEQLAAHAQWISALARKLISDPHTAEDLAQATMVRALEKGPREPAALRSWLKRVLRNLLHEKHRTNRNREAREAATVDLERNEAATDDVVERMQTAERLTTALQALEEPFRSTLFFRFYDDLKPSQIATRQGVSVATVKSRLHRGLTRLRSNLDDEYGGDRQAWMSGLLPFAATTTLPLTPAALPLGSLAMNMKAAWILGALTLAGGLFVTLRQSEESPKVTEPEVVQDSRSMRSSGGGGSSKKKPREEKERRDLTRDRSGKRETAQVIPASAPKTITLRGQVFDGEGGPFAGAALRVEGEEEIVTRSEASGAFGFETTLTQGEIEVADPGWVTLRSGSFDGRGELPPIVIAAPALSLAGRIVDEWDQGLEGARISVTAPENFEMRFPVRLDNSAHEVFEDTAQADGKFALPRVPYASGSILRVSHPGYQPISTLLENVSNEALVLQLHLPEVPEEHALRGVVLRQDGTPATEAHVALGATTVPTSNSGQFTIDLRRVLEGDEIIAVEKGAQPAVLSAPGPPSDPWPEEVILHLGPPPLKLGGVVLETNDQPLSGARVWISDGSTFGVLGNVPLQREALMAGAPLPKEGVDFLGSGPTEDGDGDFGNHMPLSAPNAILNFATTDSEGRFEILGLEDRPYTLYVVGPDLGSGTVVSDQRAGQTNLVLHVDPDLAYSSFSGQVVLANGEPVADVLLYPFLPAVSDNIRIMGGSSGVTRWFAGPSATTDKDGRFTFGAILNEGVNFYIESDQILPSYGSMDDVTDPLAHQFEVVARLHAQAELLDPTSADELAVFDTEGELVIIRTMRASGHTTWERIAFDQGRTGAFALTSEAVELRLYKNNEVVGSHPLNLRVGELNQLRY